MKKFLCISCVLALFACTQTKITGTIDSTDTGIVGKIAYSTGAVASNAQVKLFRARDTSRTALSQRNTDNSGNFKFDSLTPGSYNVWIESSDSLVAFIDSIYVPKNTLVRRDAILGKSGSITAIVRLQSGHDPQSVSVQALGTQKYSNVGASGFFTIPRLAEGEYTLRLVSTIAGYTPTYKTITVSSGVDDTLKDTIILIYTGIPPVTGITAHYDPFIGVATVSWNSMAYANLYDYLIYRDIPGSINLSTVPIAASIDTVFYDTLFKQRPLSLLDTTSLPNFQYRYHVTIRNKLNQEGQPYNFANIQGGDPNKMVNVLSPGTEECFTNGTGIQAIWEKYVPAKTYQIQVSSKSDFTDTVLNVMSSDTVLLMPEFQAGFYYLHVRAQSDRNEWGFWSIPQRFAVQLFSVSFKYPDPTNHISTTHLIQTNDSGYFILGYVNNNIIVYKTDIMGREIWHQSYGITDLNSVTCATQTIDKGYIILGSTVKTVSNHNFSDAFALKIDQSGSKQWMNTFSDTLQRNTYGEVGISIMSAPDNGAILGCSVLFLDSAGALSSYQKSKIIKVNSSGESEWTQYLDSTGSGPFVVAKDSQSFLSLSSKTGYSGPTFLYRSDTLFMCTIRFSGNTLSSKRVPFFEPGYIVSVCKITNGDYVLAYQFQSISAGVARINVDGILLWDNKTIAVNPGENIGCLHSTPDNGVDIVGNNRLDLSTSILLSNLNENGTELWNKTYGGQLSGTNQRSVVVDQDGSIVIALTEPNTGNILLFKTTKEGISLYQ